MIISISLFVFIKLHLQSCAPLTKCFSARTIDAIMCQHYFLRSTFFFYFKENLDRRINGRCLNSARC